jgi:hypothetical protein
MRVLPGTISVVALLALSLSRPCHAQIVAPLLEKQAFEVGYAYKWFDRDVPSPQLEAEWDVGSFFARFGALDWLTLAAEGGLWGVEAADGTNQDYSRWVVGGAASARLHRAKRWNLTATITYNEVYDHDKSKNRSDKRTRGWNAGVLAGTTFAPAGQRLDLWAGPMFVDDLVESYAWGVDDPLAYNADTKLGGAAGAYAVLFDYISGFAYVLYADHPQWRVGVSLRTRGGE